MSAELSVVASVENPVKVLAEAVKFYQDAGEAAATRKAAPKEELDLDAEVVSDEEEVFRLPEVSDTQLIAAGERFAEEKLKAFDGRASSRMYRALLDFRTKKGLSPEKSAALKLRLATALGLAGEIDAAVKLLDPLTKEKKYRLEAVKALFDARRLSCGKAPEPAYDWFDGAIGDPAYGFSVAEQTTLRDYYGFKAFYSMRPALMQRAIDVAAERKIPLHGHAAMCHWAIRKFKEAETFPKAESEIRFPKSLADFGVEPNGRVAHAKDFLGGDLEDEEDDGDADTRAIVAAFDSGASKVVIDDLGRPWRIKGIRLDAKRASNREVTFAKNARVLAKDDGLAFRDSLFTLDRASNAVWIAEEGVRIGHFADLETRKAKAKIEGGSGFVVNGGRHVAIRGFQVYYACCDALTLTGNVVDFYAEDCDFGFCYRQGASFGASEDCHFRRVKFHDIGPGSPGSGVDFEPSYEVWPNNNYYFFDCEFADCAGDGVTFATSTYLPVTVLFKRCTIRSTATCTIIKARPGIYWENNAKAPSKIVFEDVKFFGNSEVSPIRFQSTTLFNVTFRNCELTDRGPFYKGREPNAAAVLFLYDRPGLWKGKCELDGRVEFENFKVNGYANAPLMKTECAKGADLAPWNVKGTPVRQ